MTESNETTETNETNEISTPTRPTPSRSRRWLFLAVPAVLLGGLVGARAYAFGPGGRGDISPEQMQRFIERRIDRVLEQIDATDDQRTRIKGTLSRLQPEMKALHDEKHKLREAGLKALSANPIDANEVERLRREVVKLADRGTTLMSRAIVEVGGVLNAGTAPGGPAAPGEPPPPVALTFTCRWRRGGTLRGGPHARPARS